MTSLIQRGIEIVPGYTLVRRLGSGMAGEVWVARASGGVYVAIKIVRDMSMIGSKRELGALRIVREVKHTNLCPLIGVWFFDEDGELLSNAATDDILGRESSLIDTECLTRDRPSDGMRETHAMGLADSAADGEPPERASDADRDSHLRETGAYDGERQNNDADDSGFLAEIARRTTPPPRRGSRTTSSRSNSSTTPTAGDRRNEDDPDTSLGEAKQMVIAMGLGDKTLHDRLVEMRAPGNAPENDNDPMHIAGGVPAPELLRYITGAASAIDELNIHHNIYHCDIKPQNILIVGGNAQVCDFGLARRVHENRRTQLAIGTPAYGAPEMLFDQTYTQTIDQYSLAITYYELRTGMLPFETSRRSSFLRAKANGELRLDALPPREREVIEKATRLDPDERYESCSQFAEKLNEAVYSTGVDGTGGRRSRAVLATAVCLMALLVGGGAYYLATRPDYAAKETSGDENIVPEDTNVTDGESDVSPDPNQQRPSVSPDTLSPDISTPDISLSSAGSPTEVSSLDPDSSDSGLPESDLADVQMPDSDTPASESLTKDGIPTAAPDIDSDQTSTVASGDTEPELSATMPASLSEVSTEASEPDPVPAAEPETIDDFLQLAADDLESQLGASESPWQSNELDAFVERIETFAPTLDSAGQWSEPAIATRSGETFSEKHRERSLELAKRLRSALAIDAGNTEFAIPSDELVSFRTRVDMTIASNLIRATTGAANAKGDTQHPPISTTQPDAVSASLDSLREAIALEGVDSSNGSITPRLADAAYLIALPTINQNEISFDGNGLARVERVQKDLARAMATNVEPVRLSAIADSQGRCLLALRELRDQTIGQPSESVDVLKTIDRLSLAFVRDLDRRTDHADRQNGWQRIRGPVNVLGHTVAGLTLWDADRLSDAMRHWIEVPNDSVMSQMGPDRWRNEVATRCLEWVRENSGANDRDTSTLRYARSTKSREGVLNLAVKFADASEDLQEQIVPERFLLAVAKQDDTNAARLWDRMGLDLDDDRLTPQLGFALWTSCSRRHDAATSRRQRIDVIPDLIVGTLAQLNSRDRDRPVETAASLDPTLSQRIETTLQKLRDVADNSDEAFAVLPANLMAAPTRKLCERYVDEIRSATAPATYRGFLDRLERVRFAASTAASLASDSAEKDRMLLIAAEAFIQTRYEEIDDLPASRMIQTLYQYEDAGDRRSRSQPTIHRQFLVARAADQRGFLSREDEDVLRHYVQARNAYSKLIENRELPDDLRGSVYRCRASLLSRMAVLEPPTRKRELLELAAKDGSAAISYPPRWHHDNDDRLTTAADVNISTVRLVTDLEVAEKQKLLDDADRFLAEAIAVREQNGYPVFIQKTHRLNGYLFDLLMSPKGRRVSNREQRAMTLMSQLATEPIEGAGDDAISHTIPATSYRTRVHWHCMCAMVHRLAEHPEMAMSHIQHALHTAEDHLPRNDDRRHRAVLIYVQFRGPELLSGISKNGQADQSLVRELRSHLDTIIEPNTHFRKEKQGYVRDLDRMSK